MTTPKAQSTPGPWTIRERPAFVIEADGHVGPILEMRSPLDLPAWDPVAQATRQANARLIAASPALADTGHRLAMMALQSERYAQDAEYRDAVDDLIEALYVAGVMRRVTP